MEKNDKEILDAFKNNLLRVNNTIKDSHDFFGSNKYKSEKGQDYYLWKLENNLYKCQTPNYKLGKDAEAVRSSAAMIYNTIGEDKIIIDNKIYKVIGYEDELHGLIAPPGPQLDVTLSSNDGKERIYIEAKCLEWLYAAEKLKAAYLFQNNYPSLEVAKFFIPIFKMIIEDGDSLHDEYKSIYSRYNSKQMTIHILGIYNWCKEQTDKLPEKIRLLNIVWDYDKSEQYQKEEKEGLEYISFANVVFKNFFKEIGVDFSVEYIRYSDFLNRIDWSKDLERRKYLSRYEIKENLSENDFQEKFKTLWNETKHMDEKQSDYEARVLDDSTIDKYPGIFNKKKASERYNPKDDNGYKKNQLPTLENEDWVYLSNQYYTRYAVSSEGRVAFLWKDQLYHILKQDDGVNKGYLRLDPDGEYPVDHQIEVYKLIAMGFLGKKIGDGYEVHHKINDGYNCRVSNLILLTRSQHNLVHMSENQINNLSDKTYSEIIK